MKTNDIFKLIIIFTLAIFFRLYMLNKPEGLWNDEYIGWFISSQENITEFFKQIINNCHMPLYYVYLKVWMTLFNDSDFVLRLSSVVPSVISIWVMFNIGKEIKDSKTGYLIAFLTAISSFSIYYAQEMRLYSLLFLISSISTLYFIKFAKEQTEKNAFYFLLSNTLLCLTHTIGIAFSIFSVGTLFTYLFKTNKINRESFKNYKNLLIAFVVILLLLIPIILNIALRPTLSQFWSDFNLLKVLLTLTDYFSPMQINILTPPISFVDVFYWNNHINWHFIIFAIVPMFIALMTIYNAIKSKNEIINLSLIPASLFLLTILFFSIIGKMILLTKYTIEVYPILIAVLAYGFLNCNKLKFRNLLIVIFILINLLYLCFSNNAVYKRSRPEGHFAPINLIENSKLEYKDQIIFTFFDINKFEKYIIDNNAYKFSSIHKYNFHTVMFEDFEKHSYMEIIQNGKELYKEYFKEFPNDNIVEYTKKQYIKDMKKGDRVGIVYMNNISMHTNYTLKKFIEDEKGYEDSHFIYIAFSHLINNILYTFDKELELESIKQNGNWLLVVYRKN